MRGRRTKHTAALDHRRKCSECGAFHNFFRPDSDLFESNTTYEYTCPRTGTTGRFASTDRFGKTVEARPSDAVVVEPVDYS
jgi:hypothetical protein